MYADQLYNASGALFRLQRDEFLIYNIHEHQANYIAPSKLVLNTLQSTLQSNIDINEKFI